MNTDRFCFRVYDKKNKQYIDGVETEMFINNDASLLFDSFGDVVFPPEEPDNYIVEQCTGLKDKNGNLIYEGDVVKIGNGSINGEVMESELAVEWGDKIGRWNLPNWTSDTPDWSHYVEIIGNTHEQAEQKD